MSISSEIERIQTAKSAIITSIENKGVTVPTGAMIDELPELIYSIPSGGGGGDLPEGYTKASYALRTSSASLKFENLSIDINDKYILECAVLNADANNGGGFSVQSETGQLMYPYLPFFNGSEILPNYYYGGSAAGTGSFITYNQSKKITITTNKRYCNFTSSGYNRTADVGFNISDDKIKFLYLFDSPDTVKVFNGIIYSLKIYDKDDANKVNAEFIPAYDENNVLGFYEKISGQFQGSANLIE